MRKRTVPTLLGAGVLALAGVLAVPAVSQADHGGGKVKIYDDCDPATFNAPPPAGAGPGTCVEHERGSSHHTTFQAFIGEVAATKQAREWRFDPSMLSVEAGRPVILENRGGETHTFTMVAKFGGGFIEPLNQLSGNPEPTQECAVRLPDGTLARQPDGSLVPQPDSVDPINVFVSAGKEVALRSAGLKPGRYMFQCCIHPWMRVILTVK
jgi:plastocyanin